VRFHLLVSDRYSDLFDFNGYAEIVNVESAQPGGRRNRAGELPKEIMNLSISALDMKRFWATIFLALIVVGGSWILLNQDRIKQSGGLSAFLSQQFVQTLRKTVHRIKTFLLPIESASRRSSSLVLRRNRTRR